MADRKRLMQDADQLRSSLQGRDALRMLNERSYCLPSTNSLRWLLTLSTAVLLGACSDPAPPPPPAQDLIPQVTSPPPSPPPAPPLYPPSLQPLQGYFAGNVTIGEVDYTADALITTDGVVHISISGSSVDPVVDSAQFIGHVVADSSQALGTGMIIGQGCARAYGRFCSETPSAEINITLAAQYGLLSGTMLVATSGGVEAWQLNMSWPNPRHTLYGYLKPATLAWAEGLYYVEFADFSLSYGDTVIRVDAAGRLFFQSPSSGCVGNGTLVPHLDGAVNVYDVALTLEICNGGYAYLNGEVEGLATVSVSCPDDDCTFLTFYLASVEGAALRTGLTISARL